MKQIIQPLGQYAFDLKLSYFVIYLYWKWLLLVDTFYMVLISLQVFDEAESRDSDNRTEKWYTSTWNHYR